MQLEFPKPVPHRRVPSPNDSQDKLCQLKYSTTAFSLTGTNVKSKENETQNNILDNKKHYTVDC